MIKQFQYKLPDANAVTMKNVAFAREKKAMILLSIDLLITVSALNFMLFSEVPVHRIFCHEFWIFIMM